MIHKLPTNATGYTRVPNALILHPGLSADAKLVVITCLSKSANWKVRVKWLRDTTGLGRNRIYDAILEAIEHGYCRRIGKGQDYEFTAVPFPLENLPDSREGSASETGKPSRHSGSNLPETREENLPDTRERTKERDNERKNLRKRGGGGNGVLFGDHDPKPRHKKPVKADPELNALLSVWHQLGVEGIVPKRTSRSDLSIHEAWRKSRDNPALVEALADAEMIALAIREAASTNPWFAGAVRAGNYFGLADFIAGRNGEGDLKVARLLAGKYAKRTAAPVRSGIDPPDAMDLTMPACLRDWYERNRIPLDWETVQSIATEAAGNNGNSVSIFIGKLQEASNATG